MWMSAATAQLRVDVQPGFRFQSNSEYTESGERIISERGWLPGIGFQLAYPKDQYETFGSAHIYRADINYDGKLQNGSRYRSDTGTRLAQVQVGLRYEIRETTRAVIALEHDQWHRNIKGDGVSIGLRERTRSNRLLVGLEQEWHARFGGKLSLGATLVRAERERLHIQFSGLLDDASIRTKAATGARIDLRYHPAPSSPIQLGGQLDYIKIPRSEPVSVTRDRKFAGTITQPEHGRQSITLYLQYMF